MLRSAVSPFVSRFGSLADVCTAGNISATAGPVGGGAQVATALQHPAPMFSYTKSKGSYMRSTLGHFDADFFLARRSLCRCQSGRNGLGGEKRSESSVLRHRDFRK